MMALPIRCCVARLMNPEWLAKSPQAVRFCPFCGQDLSAPDTFKEGLAQLLDGLQEPIELVIDMDGVLADSDGHLYADARPYPGAVEFINRLFEARLSDGRQAFMIRIQTARYMKRFAGNQTRADAAGWEEAVQWLDRHGLPCHAVYLGKASGELYLDDRACRIESSRGKKDWLANLLPALMRIKRERQCLLTSSPATTVATVTKSS